MTARLSPVLEFAVPKAGDRTALNRRIEMQILQIINQVGPLPPKAQFNAALDGLSY